MPFTGILVSYDDFIISIALGYNITYKIDFRESVKLCNIKIISFLFSAKYVKCYGMYLIKVFRIKRYR